ncbi:hypothetical protein [Anaerococcus hydrogenalis]|nr:hypothetical protein [Anaerococcus hydrogenalis]MDU1316356.1 hypothetical protein [Anaerococcus hydrogenalis]
MKFFREKMDGENLQIKLMKVVLKQFNVACIYADKSLFNKKEDRW